MLQNVGKLFFHHRSSKDYSDSLPKIVIHSAMHYLFAYSYEKLRP